MIKETLVYSDYDVRAEQPSRIDPDASISVVVGWRCPRCKHTNPGEIEHAHMAECAACGLVVQRTGNVLDCWADMPTE